MHRLCNHPYEIASQCLQVRLIAEPGREGFEGLPGVVLASVEAPVYERLYAPPYGVEQRGDQEGGGDDREEERVDDGGGREERGGAREPLELLALQAIGASEA